jgi:cysteinyl-tRNA synthetase
VLFSVASFPEYGRFANRSLDEMRAGARVEVAPYKRDPMDFVLWKPSDPGLPGWDSPWGRGRPGWHIECSAMSHALLGGTFDIHGGGIDLVFPHHENEIAQSRCAHPDEAFANVWMHNGFVQVEGEKMSKSLGNFFTVRDLLDRGIPAEVIRFVLLSTHYRQPLDWTEAKVEEATRTLRKWRGLAEGIEPSTSATSSVLEALGEDLNTPRAMAALHEADDPAVLRAGAGLLGLLTDALGGWAAAPQAGEAVASRIEGLLAARLAARQSRDFARADALRAGLAAAGVVVTDRPEGAAWSLAPGFDPAKLEALR